jgi:hypothetical protein
MSRAARYRLAFVAAAILLLELLCRIGVIDRLDCADKINRNRFKP